MNGRIKHGNVMENTCCQTFIVNEAIGISPDYIIYREYTKIAHSR